MTDDKQPAVIVKDLYKSFKLPHEQHSGIKQVIVNFAKRKKGYEVQHVLDDISFEIKKGEFFGIVGRNGSGKSTLLKLLAGIYAPDKGLVQVNGSLTPFIELGVGFNPELTGRENVFLNGALLGFDRNDMEGMYDDIVEFAELERFMDQKLKNYSSGMQVRLAFSIAIRAQSDILLLDEVLAVGDEAFQRKCFEYFSQLKIAKKTVILVTHSMDSVRKFCDRALLLHDGNIESIGNIQEITKLYEEANLPGKDSGSRAKKSESKENSNKSIHVKADALDRDGDITSNFTSNDKVRLKVKIVSLKQLKDVFLGISFHKPSGEAVFVKTTEKQGETISSLEPNVPVYVDIEIQNIFAEDTYFVNVSLKSNDRSKVYLVEEDVERFNVISTGIHKTSLRPDYSIKVETKG